MMNHTHKLLALAIVLSGCGRVEREPHFEDPKSYGRPLVPADSPLSGQATTRGENEADSSGSASTLIIPATPDPNRIIASALFRGRVDPDSFRLLTSGGAVINPWDLPGSGWMRGRFDGEQEVAFTGQQTYGDEESGISKLIQTGTSGMADLAVAAGDESESGTQILERLVGNDEDAGACKTAMVCIRSMTWKPNQGSVKTFCYKDAETGKPTLFPYAPAPNFPYKDAKLAEGSYGPYTVETYIGEINCLSPSTQPTGQMDVMVRYNVRQAPSMTHVIQKRRKIVPDYSVSVTVDKLGKQPQANVQPYVDSATKVQGHSEYFISSRDKLLVKVVKRARKSITFPGDDSWLGSAIRAFNAVTPVTGILMDIHAEYCMDLLSHDFKNICRDDAGAVP
jgi:hypothetical protein